MLSGPPDRRSFADTRSGDEAEAIEQILRLVRLGDAEWIGSPAVSAEVSRNPDSDRRRDANLLLHALSRSVAVDAAVNGRAKELEEGGYDAFDALHLACAEHGGADVLLTTDDIFSRRAHRGLGSPRVRVANPLSWWQEGVR